MGQQYFSVDVAALHDVANRLETAAELITAAGRIRLGFDGSAAGRVHAAEGDALRRALDRWPGELARWSRAGAEIAAALRSGARRYDAADLGAADRVG